MYNKHRKENILIRKQTTLSSIKPGVFIPEV